MNKQTIILIAVVVLVIGIIIAVQISSEAAKRKAKTAEITALIQYKQAQAGQRTKFKDVLGGIEGLGNIFSGIFGGGIVKV